MKLIVKNGKVVATHRDDQDVLALYPGCVEIPAPDTAITTDQDGRFLALSEIDLGDPWPQIRTPRDQLLTATDWTQLADSPLDDTDKAAWVAYRQALRDIPQDQAGAAGFTDIVWPDSPDVTA
jgi:hypothetical protein